MAALVRYEAARAALQAEERKAAAVAEIPLMDRAEAAWRELFGETPFWRQP